MAADYQRELNLAAAILRQMRLPVHFLHPHDSLTDLDSGFRSSIGLQEDYEAAARAVPLWAHEQAIYQIHDQFMCCYIYFPLPDEHEPAAMVVGPYLTSAYDPKMYLEIAVRLGLDIQRFRKQSEYFSSIPIFHDSSPIFAVLTSLGALLCDSPEAVRIVNIDYEQYLSIPGNPMPDAPIEQSDILEQMHQLEMHYAFESELMQAVSKGLTHKAETMLSGISQSVYQSRTPDPLRNMKNYCIICNTLLRKAAQSGGVHPLYLDRLSSQCAHQIEAAHVLDETHVLIHDMIRSYCRLIRSHAGRQYAAIVRKTLTYIDANLSGDLSLKKLAALMQVSPGYLSTLFHRETAARWQTILPRSA